MLSFSVSRFSFSRFLRLWGAIWEPLGDPWGPKWGELAAENSILSRTPSGRAFWEALGSILGGFLEDFDDIWGWSLACGLLAVCLLLAMVCFWFACVLRLAVRFFVAFLVFLGVPLCSLVFPAFPFFARFPFPCQDRGNNVRKFRNGVGGTTLADL